ncbi:MAG TPA: TolC family protein [Pyrinomonadaceae bacterium]|nr:TolC family protein [Pyrinomonadaceae bacterium]
MGRLLLLAVLVGATAAAAPLRAQQTSKQTQTSSQRPAPKFSGSIFGGSEASKSKETERPDGAEKSKDAEKPLADADSNSVEASPAPSPIPYMTVAVRLTPGAVAAQSSAQTPSTPAPTTTQTTPPPAPSANNPPSSQTPAQSPQTASPTQSQTQQSTNPAAPAQGQQPAQPGVPATAPPQVSPATQPSPSTLETPQGQQTTVPGSQIQSPLSPSAPGAESVPAAAPQDTQLDVPQVSPDFKASEGPFPALERVGVDMSRQRTLSVREAIEMALANNKDIEVARENVRGAEFDLKAARGIYDPHFLTNSYYEHTDTPAASFLSGTTTGAVTQSGFFSTSSVQGLTPKGGGGYRVDFVNNRITTNNLFAALNPQYPTSLTFSYTQPIIKGRDFDQNRRQIEIAKKNLSLTDSQFRQRAVETITTVERAYWDLVYALRNLKIQQDAVKDARAQLEHNKRLVSEGMLAPIDVVAAEAQISGFEQSVYSALDDVGRAENNLKSLVAENRDSPLWTASIVPTDSVDLAPPQVDLREAMQVALKSRAELSSADAAREINEIEQRFAREQTKPQVDLVASYGLVGLAGTLNTAPNPLATSSAQLTQSVNQLIAAVNPSLPPSQQLTFIPPTTPQTLPGFLVGGEEQSLANIAANRFKDVRVGVTINLPFRNTTAEAQLGRTLVDAERIKTQREQLEQLIQVDVRNAVQSVITAQSRLRAAASARSASEQQYASEQRKLDAGQSTVFLVLERQTALTTARGNELRAQTELNKALADLQRATGNALEQNRVEIQLK